MASYDLDEFSAENYTTEKLKALARIHSHLSGDGCLCCYKTSEKDRKNRIEISYYNTNPNLLSSFRKDMSEFFGVKMMHYPKQVKVSIKSMRIGKFLLSIGEYKTHSWRVPHFVRNASSEIKLEWIRAFCHDEGYTPAERKTIRIKSMNGEGLKGIKTLLDGLGIESWITGQNCDGSWYLNVRKMGGLADFAKVPSRRKINSGGWI